MNTLVCGDLHCKEHILMDVIKEFEKGDYQKLVFLGDYVDDWNTSPDYSQRILMGLIEYKNKHPKEVILLLGNHDLSQWLGGDFQCAGYNPISHIVVKNLMDEYQHLFQLAYCDPEKNCLMTHAGLTSGWVKDLKMIDDIYLPETHYPIDWATYLNWAYKNREVGEIAHRVFKQVANAGMARGGIHAPSPIWADKSELIASPFMGFNQVVGHTPVSGIIKHTVESEGYEPFELVFCDTHSTTYDKENIGDNSLFYL